MLLQNVATTLFGGHRATATKRSAVPLAAIAALALLWYHAGPQTNITINMIETRQDKHSDATTKGTKVLTFTETTDVLTVDDSFRLKNLDVSKRVPCGANKCFFRLKTDPTVGYLVQPDVFRYDKRTSPEQLFHTQVVSWEFAEQLRTEHGIHHFLLEPPSKVKVTKKLARKLNANIFSEAREVKYKKRRFPRGSTAFIQKVRLAPEPNIIFGSTPTKRAYFKRNADEFLEKVSDKEAFLKRFSEGLRLTKKLLASEPCLCNDFQVLLDTSGHLHHLDFDRCFSSRHPHGKRNIERSPRILHCLRRIDEAQRHVQQILEVD